MLYNEFLKGTSGIDCKENYEEYRKLEAVYMIADDITKEDIYKQANVIKESRTSKYVEFLAQLLQLKKHFGEVAKSNDSKMCYWYFRDIEIEMDCIIECVKNDKTFEGYRYSDYAIEMNPIGGLSESKYNAMSTAREESRKIAERLGILKPKKKCPQQ